MRLEQKSLSVEIIDTTLSAKTSCDKVQTIIKHGNFIDEPNAHSRGGLPYARFARKWERSDRATRA